MVTAQGTSVNSTHIEFTQMYKNGTVLNVSNASMINVYPKSRMRLSFRLPSVKNVAQLLSLANKLIDANKQDEEKITFARGREFETVEDYLNRELNQLVKAGWVQSTVVEGNRRLTIKGALLMTWKMLWPVKQIINRIDISESSRAIDRLNPQP